MVSQGELDRLVARNARETIRLPVMRRAPGTILKMPAIVRVPLRHRVLILVALASAITYLDRVCLSAATPAIMHDLGLSNIQMGYAFSVFPLAYGIFEMPMGWLGDRLGSGK